MDMINPYENAGITDDEVFTVSLGNEAPVAVASKERDEMAQAVGGTFSKDFYRDAAGNEYFYDANSGVSEAEWLVEKQSSGLTLTKAGENERPSNYIYTYKIYDLGGEEGRVRVREDEEEAFAKRAKERGWTPQEVTTRRWNGVDFTGTNEALNNLQKDYAKDGVFRDDQLLALGATEDMIFKGKERMAEKVKKIDDQFKAQGNIGFVEHEAKTRGLNTIGRVADSAFDKFDMYLTEAKDALSLDTYQTIGEMAEAYGGDDGLRRLKNMSAFGRARMALWGGLDIMQAASMSDEELYDWFREIRENQELQKRITELRGLTTGAKIGSAAVDMAKMGLEFTTATLAAGALIVGTGGIGAIGAAGLAGVAAAGSGVGGSLLGAGLFAAGHAADEYNRQVADRMYFNPVTGKLEKLADGRRGGEAFAYTLANPLVEYAVEKVGGKIVGGLMKPITMPMKALARKALGREMSVVLGLTPGVVQNWKGGGMFKQTAMKVGRAYHSLTRNSWGKVVQSGIRGASPSGIFEELNEEALQSLVEGAFNLRGEYDYETGRIADGSILEGMKGVAEVYKNWPEFAATLVLYNIGAGTLSRGSNSLVEAYGNRATLREALKWKGYTKEQLRGMDRNAMKEAFAKEYMKGDPQAGERIKDEWLNSETKAEDMLTKLMNTGLAPTFSSNMDSEGKLYIELMGHDGEVVETINGEEAVREWAANRMGEIVSQWGESTAYTSEQLASVTKGIMFVARKEMDDVQRLLGGVQKSFQVFGNDPELVDAMQQALAMDYVAGARYGGTPAFMILKKTSRRIVNNAIQEFGGDRSAAMREFSKLLNGGGVMAQQIDGANVKQLFSDEDLKHGKIGKGNMQYWEKEDIRLSQTIAENGMEVWRVMLDGDIDKTPIRAFGSKAEALSYANTLHAKRNVLKERHNFMKFQAEQMYDTIFGGTNGGERQMIVLRNAYENQSIYDQLVGTLKRKGNGEVAEEGLMSIPGAYLADGTFVVFTDNCDSVATLAATIRHEGTHTGIGALYELSKAEERAAFIRDVLPILSANKIALKDRFGRAMTEEAFKTLDEKEQEAVLNETLAYLSEVTAEKPGLMGRVTGAVANLFSKSVPYDKMSARQRQREVSNLLANVYASVNDPRFKGVKERRLASQKVARPPMGDWIKAHTGVDGQSYIKGVADILMGGDKGWAKAVADHFNGLVEQFVESVDAEDVRDELSKGYVRAVNTVDSARQRRQIMNEESLSGEQRIADDFKAAAEQDRLKRMPSNAELLRDAALAGEERLNEDLAAQARNADYIRYNDLVYKSKQFIEKTKQRIAESDVNVARSAVNKLLEQRLKLEADLELAQKKVPQFLRDEILFLSRESDLLEMRAAKELLDSANDKYADYRRDEANKQREKREQMRADWRDHEDPAGDKAQIVADAAAIDASNASNKEDTSRSDDGRTVKTVKTWGESARSRKRERISLEERLKEKYGLKKGVVAESVAEETYLNNLRKSAESAAQVKGMVDLYDKLFKEVTAEEWNDASQTQQKLRSLELAARGKRGAEAKALKAKEKQEAEMWEARGEELAPIPTRLLEAYETSSKGKADKRKRSSTWKKVEAEAAQAEDKRLAEELGESVSQMLPELEAWANEYQAYIKERLAATKLVYAEKAKEELANAAFFDAEKNRAAEQARLEAEAELKAIEEAKKVEKPAKRKTEAKAKQEIAQEVAQREEDGEKQAIERAEEALTEEQKLYNRAFKEFKDVGIVSRGLTLEETFRLAWDMIKRDNGEEGFLPAEEFAALIAKSEEDDPEGDIRMIVSRLRSRGGVFKKKDEQLQTVDVPDTVASLVAIPKISDGNGGTLVEVLSPEQSAEIKKGIVHAAANTFHTLISSGILTANNPDVADPNNAAALSDFVRTLIGFQRNKFEYFTRLGLSLNASLTPSESDELARAITFEKADHAKLNKSKRDKTHVSEAKRKRDSLEAERANTIVRLVKKMAGANDSATANLNKTQSKILALLDRLSSEFKGEAADVKGLPGVVFEYNRFLNELSVAQRAAIQAEINAVNSSGDGEKVYNEYTLRPGALSKTAVKTTIAGVLKSITDLANQIEVAKGMVEFVDNALFNGSQGVKSAQYTLYGKEYEPEGKERTVAMRKENADKITDLSDVYAKNDYNRSYDPEAADDAEVINFKWIGPVGASALDQHYNTTSRMDGLTEAKALSKSGMAAQKILNTTGWQRDPIDGQWKYWMGDDFDKSFRDSVLKMFGVQIDTSSIDEYFYKLINETDATAKQFLKSMLIAELRPVMAAMKDAILRRKDSQDLTLKDFGIDEYFIAYPELANAKVRFTDKGSNGGYNPKTNTFLFNLGSILIPVQKTKIHETQHFIQQQEKGWAKSATSSSIKQASLRELKRLIDSGKYDGETLEWLKDEYESVQNLNADDVYVRTAGEAVARAAANIAIKNKHPERILIKNALDVPLEDILVGENTPALVEHLYGGGRDAKLRIGPLYTGTTADYAQRLGDGTIVNGPSLHYVGTGEGAQAYGWGLYASQKREVADSYAEADADRKWDAYQNKVLFRGTEIGRDDLDFIQASDAESQIIAELIFERSSVDDKIKQIEWRLQDFMEDLRELQSYFKNGDEEELAILRKNIRDAEEQLKLLKSGDVKRLPRPSNNEYVYEQTFFTDRPEGDESHLLSWLDPVPSHLKKNVIDQLKKEFDFDAESEKYLLDRIENSSDGDILYFSVGQVLREKAGVSLEEAPKAASEFLVRAGIDGVKVPVGAANIFATPNGDENGWNYISFRDDNIEVNHKYVNGEMLFRVSNGSPYFDLAGGVYGDGSMVDYSERVKHGATVLKSLGEGVYDKLIQSRGPLFRAIRSTLKRLGVPESALPDEYNVEASMKNVHGKIRMRAEQIHRKYLDPLRKLIKDHKLDTDRLDEYLYAKFAPERNKLIKERTAVVDPNTGQLIAMEEDGSGMSDAEASRIMQRFANDPKREAYDKAMHLVWEMNGRASQLAVDYGFVTVAQRKTWMKLSPHYVPLKDLDSKHFTIRRSAGRSTKAASPLAASVYQAQEIIRRGELARCNQTLAKFINHYGNGEGLLGARLSDNAGTRKAVVKGDPVFVPNGSEAEVELMKAGVSLVETPESAELGGKFIGYDDIPNELRVVVQKSMQHAPNVATYWENGVRKYIVFDKHNAEAMKIADAVNNNNLLSTGDNAASNLVRRLTRWKADVSTTLNPKFVLRNMGADFFNTAMILMTEGKYKELGSFAKDYIKAMKTVRDFAKGKQIGDSELGKYYLEARENGMLTGVYGEGTFKEAAHKLSRDIKRMQGGSLRQGWEGFKEFMETIGSYPEQGARLAVYAAMRKRGMSPAQAAQYGREVTVDFNAKGEWTPVINTLYMFSNAGAQGVARAIKALQTGAEARGGGMQGYVRAAMPGIMVSLALGYLSSMMMDATGDDDEEDGVNTSKYARLPEHVKSNNVAIPFVGDTYIQLPTRGMWQSFTNLGTLIYDFQTGRKDAEEVVAGFTASMRDATDFIGGNAPTLGQWLAPTVFDPLVQVLEGKDWAGREIYRKDFGQGGANAHRGKNSTGSLYKMIAEGLNTATGGDKVKSGLIDLYPETYQLFTEFMLGSLAQLALNDVPNTLQTVAGAREAKANDIPAIGGVLRQSSDVESQYYTEFAKFDKVYKELKGYRKERMTAKTAEERQKWRDREQALIAKYPWARSADTLNAIASRITKLKKQTNERNESSIDAQIEKQAKNFLRFIQKGQ